MPARSMRPAGGLRSPHFVVCVRASRGHERRMTPSSRQSLARAALPPAPARPARFLSAAGARGEERRGGRRGQVPARQRRGAPEAGAWRARARALGSARGWRQGPRRAAAPRAPVPCFRGCCFLVAGLRGRSREGGGGEELRGGRRGQVPARQLRRARACVRGARARGRRGRHGPGAPRPPRGGGRGGPRVPPPPAFAHPRLPRLNPPHPTPYPPPRPPLPGHRGGAEGVCEGVFREHPRHLGARPCLSRTILPRRVARGGGVGAAGVARGQRAYASGWCFMGGQGLPGVRFEQRRAGPPSARPPHRGRVQGCAPPKPRTHDSHLPAASPPAARARHPHLLMSSRGTCWS